MLIVDGHCDTLWAANRDGRDWTQSSATGHADLERMISAGVNIQFFALFSDPNHRGPGYALKALEMIESFHSGIEKAAREHELTLGIVRTRQDVDRAAGGFWGLLSIEGGEVIDRSLDALFAFYRLGVRSMGLVWNHRNALADGVMDGAAGGGLTPFGKEVVKAMWEIGMIVDVSHLSEAGFWDLVRISRGPIVASHSNARALCDHPRNLTDDQIRAVAETGGVVGVNFYPGFLTSSGRAGIEDILRHIEYIAEVGGIGCVGLGSDFDGFETPPQGMEDIRNLPDLIPLLRQRGYQDREIAAVMGENWARLLKTVLPPSSSEAVVSGRPS